MFTEPFRWEWVSIQGRPASECVVFDASDEVVATCVTDLHAAELCERLNNGLIAQITLQHSADAMSYRKALKFELHS